MLSRARSDCVLSPTHEALRRLAFSPHHCAFIHKSALAAPPIARSTSGPPPHLPKSSHHMNAECTATTRQHRLDVCSVAYRVQGYRWERCARRTTNQFANVREPAQRAAMSTNIKTLQSFHHCAQKDTAFVVTKGNIGYPVEVSDGRSPFGRPGRHHHLRCRRLRGV